MRTWMGAAFAVLFPLSALAGSATGTLRVTVNPAFLASGNYNFTDTTHLLNIDSGYGTTTVGLYNNVNDACQQWAWNGSQLSTPTTACGVPGNLSDNGSGNATLVTPGDNLTIAVSGSGYTIKDQRTGKYFASDGVSGATGVVTQTAAYVWGVTNLNPGNGIPHQATDGCTGGAGDASGSCFNTVVFDLNPATQSLSQILNCDGASNGWALYGGSCGDFSIVQDGGNQVLKITTSQADTDTAGGTQIYIPSMEIPESFFAIGTMRTDATTNSATYPSHNNECALGVPFSMWFYSNFPYTDTFPNQNHQVGPDEVDAPEADNDCSTQSAHLGVIDWDGSPQTNYASVSENPTGWTNTVYWDYANRMTSDGAGHLEWCGWAAPHGQALQFQGCQTGTQVSPADAADRLNPIIWGPYGGIPQSNLATGSTYSSYLLRYTVYSCANWNTGVSINGTTITTSPVCDGTLLSSQ